MLKMCVDEAVRMVLGAFMVMNVLKGRLQERQRQHEVHKNGNAGSHRHILSTYYSSVRFFFVRAVGSSEIERRASCRSSRRSGSHAARHLYKGEGQLFSECR